MISFPTIAVDAVAAGGWPVFAHHALCAAAIVLAAWGLTMPRADALEQERNDCADLDEHGQPDIVTEARHHAR